MQIDRQLQDLCWLIIGGLLTVRLLSRYIPKHINKGETEMTEKKCRACGNKLILLTSFIDGVQGESSYFHPNLQECPHVIFVRKQKNKRKVKQ
jgi:hypothetical protein